MAGYVVINVFIDDRVLADGRSCSSSEGQLRRKMYGVFPLCQWGTKCNVRDLHIDLLSRTTELRTGACLQIDNQVKKS